jgi:hypothetical protein
LNAVSALLANLHLVRLYNICNVLILNILLIIIVLSNLVQIIVREITNHISLLVFDEAIGVCLDNIVCVREILILDFVVSGIYFLVLVQC